MYTMEEDTNSYHLALQEELFFCVLRANSKLLHEIHRSSLQIQIFGCYLMELLCLARKLRSRAVFLSSRALGAASNKSFLVDGRDT